MPEVWPQLDAKTIAALAGKPFSEVAFTLLKYFTGEAIAPDVLLRACNQAYASFPDKDVCPLVEIEPGQFLLELFHGPSFAFKDIAMQLLAQLIEGELSPLDGKITIMCATSGDTGAAAVSAFKDAEHAGVVILFPHNRISEIQRKQITASGAKNILPIAIEGSFDDAQAIVKALFSDAELSDRLRLVSVNSINWARIAAQISYYFTSALQRAGKGGRPSSFCVPTGNFGDIFAGFAAKKMGLPISRLIIATNENDILVRALATGRYEVKPVTPTTSPSMDIQLSSNFERLLFEASDRKASCVAQMMKELAEKRFFTIGREILENIRSNFTAERASEAEVMEKMKDVHNKTRRFVDPHTAVALVAAEKTIKPGEDLIVLSTAHAAKFPDAVKRACGALPPMPEKLAAAAAKEENYIVLPANVAKVHAYLQQKFGS
jgi:threonine synthase